MMRKLVAQPASAVLALTMVLAPVLCCCPVKQAVASINAAPAAEHEHDCCPEQRSDKPAAPLHDDCDCGGRMTMAQPDADAMWVAPATAHLLPVAAFVPVAFHLPADDPAPHARYAVDRQPPPTLRSLVALHCMLTT